MPQLPAEVLASIFSLLTRRVQNIYPRMDWIQVTHVCRHWRLAALDYSNLWSHIYSFNNKAMVEAFLVRSNTALLTICFDMNSEKNRVNNFRLALEHMHRIRELEISVVTDVDEEVWESIADSLAKSAPNLEKLCLEQMLGVRIPLVFSTQMFAHHTPLLKSLAIYNFKIPWDFNLLRGLTELRLSRLREEHQPTIPDLLSVLKNCPDLELLVLDRVGPPPSVIPHERISLPRLRKLRFASAVPNFCSKFLGCLKLHSGVEWDIQLHSYPLASSVIIMPRGTQDMICESLHVTLEHSSIVFESISRIRTSNVRVPARLTLNIRQEYYEVRDIVDKVHALIKACLWCEAESVTFRFNDSFMKLDKDSWTTLLSCLSHLQFLACDFNLDSMKRNAITGEGLMSALMHTRYCSNSEIRICPLLRRFELYGVNLLRGVFESLLTLLHYRRGQRKPIKHMKISSAIGLSNSMVDKMQSVVDEVLWDSDAYDE